MNAMLSACDAYRPPRAARANEVMPGWDLLPGPGGETSLCLRGHVTPAMIDAVQGAAFSRVVLGYGSWQGLDFLRGRDIDRLTVRGARVDWNVVGSWTGLRALVLESTLETPVDFSLFPHLHYLDATGDAALERCLKTARSLQALRLRKPSATGIDALVKLPALRALSIVQCADIEVASHALQSPDLRFAQFVRCGRLARIGDLASCSQLASLNFLRCNKLFEIACIASAPALREFMFDSVRLRLADRGHDPAVARKSLMRFPFPGDFDTRSESAACLHD